MQITKELIEALLWEAEGTTLDFKSTQYPFAGASDDEKGELLKDILAFANAFRREDAFILIGVKEVKGGRAQVTGVLEQLEDAHLQQFVNSKVQRPIVFAYKAIEIDGLPVSLIHIPRQKRPFHSKVNFGGVAKDIVYVRRGSSTGTASPDEIAGMGADQIAAHAAEPRLELGIVDRSTGQLLGTCIECKCLVLNGPEGDEIPDYVENSSISSYGIPLESADPDYYRDLIAYTYLRHLVNKISFSMTNAGDVTALDVRLVFDIPDTDDVFTLLDCDDFPEPPKAHYDHYGMASMPSVHARDTLSVRRIGDTWRVQCLFGKIQPKDTVWLDDDLLIGAAKSIDLTVQAKIFADNLGQPLSAQCLLKFEVEYRDVTLEECEALEFERFRNTPEGLELMNDSHEEPEDQERRS